MITQVDVKGSAPQACGARVIVSKDAMSGTIGGGQLEYRAVELARSWLSAGQGLRRYRYSVALGSRYGQCCGGRVQLLYEMLDHSDLPWVHELQAVAAEGAVFSSLNLEQSTGGRRVCAEDEVPPMQADASVCLHRETLYERLTEQPTTLLLFGAGHVAQALVPRLAGLPFRVNWFDSREAVFQERHTAEATAIPELGADPLYEINCASAGSFYLILTHSHTEDFDILQAILTRNDADWIGLIGSKTKWRRFERRLDVRGFSHKQIASVHCPIGLPGMIGKQPQIIAASVVAQLLLARTSTGSGRTSSALNEQENYCDV